MNGASSPPLLYAECASPLETGLFPVHARWCPMATAISPCKTGCPLKLSRVEPGQYLDGRPRLLLEEVLVRPAGGAHPVVCVGSNAPV